MALVRKMVKSPLCPQPIGPYNQAVIIDRLVYVSGCLGLDKDKMELVAGGVAAEAHQAFKSLGYILQAAGSSYNNVVKTTVFLDDMNDFGIVNQVYKEYFTKNFPARSCIQVGKLPLNAKVEIEVVAAVGEVETIS